MLFVIFSITGFTQKLHVADETYATQSKSGGLRVSTSNKAIADGINKLRWTSVSYKIKHDRKGEYVEYSFTFKPTETNNVINLLKSSKK